LHWMNSYNAKDANTSLIAQAIVLD